MSADDLPTRAQLEKAFNDSGEKDRLREMLIERLRETGWNEKIEDEARRIVQEKGVDMISLPQLVQEITPFSRQNVPTAVKRDVLAVMKKFVEEKSGVDL